MSSETVAAAEKPARKQQQRSLVTQQKLLDAAIQPEFVYRHSWRSGDLLVWDDRSSMHRAFADYDLRETRTLSLH